MPNAWLPDEEAEAVYAAMSSIKKEAMSRNLAFIVGGDFNASIGAIGDLVDNACIGEHGFGVRNLRGDDLAAWVAEETLSIANTQFPSPSCGNWTHYDGRRHRQAIFLYGRRDEHSRIIFCSYTRHRGGS